MTTRPARTGMPELGFACPPPMTAAGPTTLTIAPSSTAPPSSLRTQQQHPHGNASGRFSLSKRVPVAVRRFDRYKGPPALVANAALTPVPPTRTLPSKHAAIAPPPFSFETPIAAPPKNTKAFPKSKIHREESLDLSSCLYLVQLPVQQSSIFWPCLAFSKYSDAQRLHHELYPKQLELNKQLLDIAFEREVCRPPGKTSDDNGSTFKVVLPLGSCSACCSAPFAPDTPFLDVDASSAVGGLDLIGQYHQLFQDSPPGSQRHVALMEMCCLFGMASGRKRSRDEPESKGQTVKFPKYKQSVIETSRSATDAMDIDATEVSFPSGPTATCARQGTGSAFAPAANATLAHMGTRAPEATTQEKPTVVNRSIMFQSSGAATENAAAAGNISRHVTASGAKQQHKAPPMKAPSKASFQTPKPAKASSKSVQKKKGKVTTVKFPKGPRNGQIPASHRKTREWEEPTGSISIATWSDVKPLLELFGYVFDKNLFCRPNGDPRGCRDAIEGEDYFTTLKDFRRFLCIHGVDYPGRLPWDKRREKNKTDMVIEWVRYSIVTTVRDAKQIRKSFLHFEMSPATALDTLKAHGVVKLHGYTWCLPWAPHVNPGQELDVLKYLGEHGIPTEFESKMETNELLALQFYLAEKYMKHNETMNKRPERYRPRESPAPSLHTPEASKDALEAATRAPLTGDHSTPRDSLQPRQLMSEEGLDNSHLAIEEPSRQDNLTQQHDSSEGHFVDARDQTTMDVGAVDDSTTDVAVPQAINEKDEQLANDKTEVPSKCNTTAEEGPKSAASSSSEKSDSQKMTRDPSKSSASNEGDVSMETSIEKSVILPGVTIQEKLQGCLNALRKASDEKIVASGNLLSSHDEIRKFLRHVIKSKGRKGGRLNSIAPLLYICGAPGTGKTISTTQLCNEAVEENENGRQPWEKPPRVCYVNCTGMQGLKKQEVLDKIMTEMNVNSVKRSRTDEDSAFAVILILDEVDTMFGSKGLEEAFEKLAGWARDEETTFSLIGISNSVNNNKTSRMFEFGMGVNKIVFQRYRKDQLVEITKVKIGLEVVDKKAMEFVAAKVAASSGDARKYLDLMNRAILRCRDTMSLTKLDTPLVKPVVTIRDAMFAIRLTNTKYKDVINGLSMLDSVTLCTGVHLARKFDGKEVTIKNLRDIVMECFGIEYDLEVTDFKGVLERLVDSGLLILPEDQKLKLKQGMLMQELSRCCLRFDLQLEDVESALEETVMKESFYQRIVERVKSIRVNDY